MRVPIPVLTFPVPLDASVVTQRLRQHVPKWSSDGVSACCHVAFASCFTSECLRACTGLSLAFGTPDSSVLLWDIRRPSAPMAAIGTPHGNAGMAFSNQSLLLGMAPLRHRHALFRSAACDPCNLVTRVPRCVHDRFVGPQDFFATIDVFMRCFGCSSRMRWARTSLPPHLTDSGP